MDSEGLYTPSGEPEILTSCGEYFRPYYFHHRGGMCIETIAHGLAVTARFNGHTRVPYSVAQHSVRVSRLVPPEHALAGLIHDAAEAYIGDMVRPFKVLMPDFQDLERAIMRKLSWHHQWPFPIPDEVHAADLTLCAAEARDYMPGDTWQKWGLPDPSAIKPTTAWDWRLAKRVFLDRYKELTS